MLHAFHRGRSNTIKSEDASSPPSLPDALSLSRSLSLFLSYAPAHPWTFVKRSCPIRVVLLWDSCLLARMRQLFTESWAVIILCWPGASLTGNRGRMDPYETPMGAEEGHQTGVSAWSRPSGPRITLLNPHPHPPFPALCSRLAQLLPHVAQKNSVLVLQTKDLNFWMFFFFKKNSNLNSKLVVKFWSRYCVLNKCSTR